MQVITIPRVYIRCMLECDLPAVQEIEQLSYECPWDEQIFRCCERQYDCMCMVTEQEVKVVGFMICKLHKRNLQLLNLAVHPARRRRGIGSHMIRKLITTLRQQRRARIVIEVRETNLPAQLFLQHHGFRAVGVLRGQYGDSAEDAYLMQFRSSDSQVPGFRIRAEKRGRKEEDGDDFRLVPAF